MQGIPAGIEISKTTLIACAGPPDAARQREFPNTRSGHQAIGRWLRGRGRVVRVCLEATGTYGLDLAVALQRTPGVELMVVNPRAARRFAQALLQRAKTDRLDAQVLHQFAARMPFVPWQPPPPECLELRALARRIQGLTRQRAAEKSRLHALRQTRTAPRLVTQSLERQIRHLGTEIERLEKAGQRHIRRHEDLDRRFRLLRSITGIGVKSALQLLGELAALPEDLDPRQWVAFAGLDPRPYESGTSVHRPRRISKAGNVYLRRPLYMPALVAVRHDPYFHAFYQRLLDRGKLPLQALVAVMRKLLHAIWGTWLHRQDFDGARLFPQLRPINQKAA